jgi:cell division protein FtsW
MIFSASSIYSWERYKDSAFFLKRHISFIFLGVLAAFLAMAIDYRKLKKYSKPLLIFAFILLALVLIPGIGREVGGARRWFRFKLLSFQPSELASLALIIYMADFLSRKKSVINNFWQGFLPAMLVLGLTVGLIILQPDLGTSLALVVLVFTMFFLAGLRLSYLLYIALINLPLLFILIFSVPYRRMRILTFLNPWADPKGSGFQIIQSQVALGSGGFFGLGLGHSLQKLFYLPAAHTDFVFSIIGEELGLLGTVGIIILFIVFIHQGYKIAKNTSDVFGHFLALGLVLMIALKAAINIGVSCGILPTKGLPLPFISYGGSSFIFDLMYVGLLLNIARTGDYP